MTEEVTSRARHLDLDIYTYLPCDLQHSLHFPLVVMGQICNTLCTLVVVVVCRNHQLILAPAAGGDWRRLFTHTRHWLHIGPSSFGRIHAQTLTVILSQYIGFIISTIPHAQITPISPSCVATRYIYLVGNKRWSHDLDDLNTFFWYQKLFKNLKTITIIPPTSWTGQRTVTTLHDEDLTQNASLIRNGTVHFIFANARLSNLWTVDMIIMGMGWNWFKCITWN